MHGASEGFFGIPLNEDQDKNCQYTFVPTLCFLEFVKESEALESQPKTLLLDELQIGERYEVVVSSACSGFFRYRMGDIIEVVGRLNKTPVYEFKTRIGGMLDLRSEKTTEDMMFDTVQTTLKKWNNCKGLLDFTVTDSLTLEKSCPDIEQTGSLYYVVFLELDGLDRKVTESEVKTFDDCLREVNTLYGGCRANDSIKMMKIFILQKGTFNVLKDKLLAVNKASSSSQYKPPRYQKRQDMVDFLIKSSY